MPVRRAPASTSLETMLLTGLSLAVTIGISFPRHAGAQALAEPTVASSSTVASELLHSDPWLEAGYTEEQRQQLREAIRSGIEGGYVAGASMLVIHDNVEIFREGFGHADLESGRAFTTDLPVALASISKPHTATTIMMLVGRGELRLDDPVDRYLPYFSGIKLIESGEPAPAPTIRQLLSHTAGFPRLGEVPMVPLVFDQPGFDAACRAIADHGLAYRPGEGYAYTDIDYVTVAHVAEVVTGKDFDDLMHEILLAPIGADSTTFRPSQEVIDRMPIRYEHGDGKLTPQPPRNERGPGTTFDPGGSLVGTLDGVARLFLLHFNHGRVNDRQLIDPTLLAEMYVAPPSAEKYGLGINLQWMPDDGTKPMIRHGGAFATMGWVDFERRIVGVFFTQARRAREVIPYTTRVFTTIAVTGLGRMTSAENPGN